ncbi:hypothetical protein C8F01DRAFT_1148190 [Mycena amicta]|nr:hypothetical protein C8F01DRAFT_1148190 [Mycena amicta]
MSVDDQLDILRTSLNASAPYTCGIHTVQKEDLGLYFNTHTDGASGYIDLASPTTEEQVKQLAAACEKATFGNNHGDVLDETYRKAGKLEVENFGTRLDVLACGLVDQITPDLLVGQDGKKNKGGQIVRAEIYKLNVYGPGSFFKAHKDTPRAKNMIGSLVVVLPTQHQGGALTLNHGEKKWTFDSGSELKRHQSSTENAPPAVAYIAFFSDVTHTVEPVVSGYRVTLTYNLFLSKNSTRADAPNTIRLTDGPDRACETAFRALLANPAWFPAGGLLGFGLQNKYPMSRTSPIDIALLKGSDARLKSSAMRLGLTPCIRLVYDLNHAVMLPERFKALKRVVLMDKAPWIRDVDPEEGGVDAKLERQGDVYKMVCGDGSDTISVIAHAKKSSEKPSKFKSDSDEGLDYDEDSDDEDNLYGFYRPRTPTQGLYWVTRQTYHNSVETTYFSGDSYDSYEHSVDGYAALFVRIPSASAPSRSIFKE